MKLLQINTTVNSGSTGRIAEDIGKKAISAGHVSYIAAAYTERPSVSKLITIGNTTDRALHGIKSRFLDRHGFGSSKATDELLDQIKEISPDIIHLHNLHGYYIHVGKLFNYLKETNIPVVWTLHDCWSFTGHCCFFDFVHCDKWKTKCCNCPLYNKYPKSLFIDNSTGNFFDKKQLFNGHKNLTLITPSRWLEKLLTVSFLNSYPAQTIHNGIDTSRFCKIGMNENTVRTKMNLPQNKNVILGVASTWDRRKGLGDFLKLSKMIADTEVIVLVGLSRQIIKTLPHNIIGIERTENVEELVALYSLAMVFVNPTWVDNFPTTNLEALSCGTPIVTFNTGGSIEAVDENTGFIVDKGDIESLKSAIELIKVRGKVYYTSMCRKRALLLFNENERFADYLALYEAILQKNSTVV